VGDVEAIVRGIMAHGGGDIGFTLSTAAVEECARRFDLDGPYPPSA
jgi:hypothetical protein